MPLDKSCAPMRVGATETLTFAGSRESSCEAHHRGRLLSKVVLEGNEVTPAEAQAKWDSWAATQAALYLTDDFEPDLRGARSYDKYRLVYCTIDANGDAIRASALLTVPRGPGRFTIIVYHHGTNYQRIDAPSNPDETQVFEGPSVEVTFSPFAILIAPDLSGFEESSLVKHQYIVAGEAEGSIDAMIAAAQVWSALRASNGKVVSIGFSAGSHVALAFSRRAQELGLPVTGTAVIGTISQPGAWLDALLDLADNDDPYFTLGRGLHGRRLPAGLRPQHLHDAVHRVPEPV